MDGREMISRVKRIPSLQNAVIIAVSANSEFILGTSKVSCDDFLPKPVDLDRLLKVLETHLQLDWQKCEPVGNLKKPNTIIVPDRQSLVELLESARLGDLKTMESLIDALEKESVEYLPFIQEVRQLTDSLQLDRLETFVRDLLCD